MGGDKTEKTTKMVLKVDLQCCSCYRKVKKVLCQFPQIRDQVYDEKANTVTITVVCCDPEKIRDKLCCKGCGVIKIIEITKPPKSTTPKPDPVPPSPQIPRPPPVPVIVIPIQEYPPPPRGYCCGQCYEGQTGGPCYHWYRRPVPPTPCYRNYGFSYGPGPYVYGRGCYRSKCDQYFSDENALGCSVM